MHNNNIRWLHLTDIHSGKDRFDQELMFGRIVTRVKQRIGEGFVPDLLFISGDVANTGVEEEYAFFYKDLLKPLQEAIGPSISERTFIVPGNHDVNTNKNDSVHWPLFKDPNYKFFSLGARGQARRENIIERFSGFYRAPFTRAQWIPSQLGAGATILELGNPRVSVGIALINTAWLCGGTSDVVGRLQTGINLVENALLQIKDTKIRFVLGHHPINWMEPAEESLLRSLFSEYHVVYICGHLHKACVFQPPITTAWPVCVQGLAVYQADETETIRTYATADRHADVNGFLWGQLSPSDEKLLLQPDVWSVPVPRAWQIGFDIFPAANRDTMDNSTWWAWKLPERAPIDIVGLVSIPLLSTRYTRKTPNNRVVDEHDRRAGDEDIGPTPLSRCPMRVTEAISFFRRVLLIGESGSGKTMVLDGLYDILKTAVELNEPALIRETFPDWRHANLAMPIRINALDFCEWLEDSPQAPGPNERTALFQYAIEMTDACPTSDYAILETHCLLESFMLLIDDWGSLPLVKVDNVWRKIDEAVQRIQVHSPALVVTLAFDSANIKIPISTPSEPQLERITIAPLSLALQEEFVDAFCAYVGRSSAEGRAARDSIRVNTETPRRLFAVLNEWEARGFPPALSDIRTRKDIYKLRLSQAIESIGSRRSLLDLRSIGTRLLECYIESPADRVLRMKRGDSDALLFEELHHCTFLHRHRDGSYSVRQTALQDYLIAWELAEHANRDLREILSRLLSQSDLRREPLKCALLWLWGDAEGSESVNTTLQLLLHGYTTGNERQVITAVAAFIAETGPYADHGDWQLAELLATVSKRIERLSVSGENLTSIDRFTLGRALDFSGDQREGVGLDRFSCLPEFIWIEIPDGTALLGRSPKDKSLYFPRTPPNDEKEYSISIPESFYLSKYPVTVRQFNAFIADEIHGYKASRVWQGLMRPMEVRVHIEGPGNHPVSFVSWDEASAFCRWYSHLNGIVVELPSSQYWEYAAHGGGIRQLFPFGDEIRLGVVNSQEEGLPGTTAVGMFPLSKSKQGCSDMCGNVFEWCSDAHDANDKDLSDYKVTKGGSYNHDLLRCRNALRGKKNRSSQHPYLGFRVSRNGLAPKTSRRRIIIAGGGFSATCTTIRLLAQLEESLEIIVVEKQRGRAFGGLAYSAETAHWEHLFNLQAGRISLFREDRDDLVEWLRSSSTDKTGWPRLYSEQNFSRSSAVPRRLYQQYLKHRLREAADAAYPEVVVRLVEGEVVRVGPSSDDRTVYIRTEFSEEKMPCEQVILCTGNLQMKQEPFLYNENVRKSRRYIDDQYCNKARKLLREMHPEEKILVIGSALRAYDVVVTLWSPNSDSRNRDVNITMVSRHGYSHPTYSSDHEHAVIPLPKPGFIEKSATSPKLSKEEFVSAVKAAYKEAFHSAILKSVPEDLRNERILKAWEFYVPEAVLCLDNGVVNELLLEYNSLITIFRIGVVPEIGDLVEEAKKAGKCSFLTATIESISRRTDDKFTVEFLEGNGKRLEVFDVIINCMGRERDYGTIADDIISGDRDPNSKTHRNPLWRQLLSSGIACRDELSGSGIEVNHEGMLINSAGKASEWISAVGVMREGSEFARFGRLGSFSFTLGPIKNQAFEAATYVLRRLRQAQSESVWSLKAQSLIPEPGRTIDMNLCENIVRRCVTEAWRGLNLRTYEHRLVAQILSNPERIKCILLYKVEKLSSRTRAERLQWDANLHEMQTDLELKLCSDIGGQKSEIARFVSHLFMRFEDIAVAQLTRLDEVEPGDLAAAAR